MDNSTESVTVWAVFLTDILKNYENKREDYEELFEIVEGYDLSVPNTPVPMEVYNQLCNWVEENLGKFNLIQLGRNVGETSFQFMLANNMVRQDATPSEIIATSLQIVSTAIQDPKGRGMEILETTDNTMKLRRTQTFNGKLQLGVLDGLVRKAQVSSVRVAFQEEIDKGADFDEYKVTWTLN